MNITDNESIVNKEFPEKLFYRIGDVSKISGIEPYVLRYWESEFPFIKPRKSVSGQRVYTKKEIELILQIKRLLYEEKYTIEGVRKKFEEMKNNKRQSYRTLSSTKNNLDEWRDTILRIKTRLMNLLTHLEEPSKEQHL